MKVSKQVLQRRRLRIVSWLLVAFAVIILAAGIGYSWYISHNQSYAEPGAPGIVEETDVASESMPSTEKPKPDAFAVYKVEADKPRYLFVPKLLIKAMVKPVGVTQDNRIESPANAYDAGWYTGSAKPGDAGAVLLDGHVSAGATPGVFARLSELTTGDEIRIEKGNGQLITYRVVETKTYSVKEVDDAMPEILAPKTANPGLNLITCTGNPVRGSNNYDQRLVVYAEQV